ncbi:uncharacterized protein LOC131882775 [Tigriopus californicus]|uniref:uncharacterized protein LOC131882775 n=1 Tax=Tigriopus californicus TaxID=6832 RepID=UPI0027DA3D43|nr:uncharacterized protein LOC131882775 [Tigriopus californicus]|eukprot:TCALIF_09354-PA protein Name:"Protein of unknown function" AED:0.01 eAED:0.01 QI:0/1/0.6/1/1/1/5/33/1119
MDKRPWTICVWSAIVGFSLVSGSGTENQPSSPNHDQANVEVQFLGPKRVGLFNIENLQSSERVIRGQRSKRVLPRYKRAFESEFYDWNRFRNNLAHGGSEAINYGIGCANVQTKVDVKQANGRRKRQTGDFFEEVNHPRGFPEQFEASLRLKHPGIPREHLNLLTGGANAANLGIGWAKSGTQVTGSQRRNPNHIRQVSPNRANLGQGQAHAYNFGIGCANANTRVDARQSGDVGGGAQNFGSGGSQAYNFGIGCANAGTQVEANQGGSKKFGPYLSRNPFNDKDNFFKQPQSKSNRYEYPQPNEDDRYDLTPNYGYDGSYVGSDDTRPYLRPFPGPRNPYNRYGFRYGPVFDSTYVTKSDNLIPDDYTENSASYEDANEPEALRTTEYVSAPSSYRSGPFPSLNFAPGSFVEESPDFPPTNYDIPINYANQAQGLTRAEALGIGSANAVSNVIATQDQGFNPFLGLNSASGTSYSTTYGVGNANAVANSVAVQNRLKPLPQSPDFRYSQGPTTNTGPDFRELDYLTDQGPDSRPYFKHYPDQGVNSNRHWRIDHSPTDEYDTTTNDNIDAVNIVPVPFYGGGSRQPFPGTNRFTSRRPVPITNRVVLIPLDDGTVDEDFENHGVNRNERRWGVQMNGDQVFPPNRNLIRPVKNGRFPRRANDINLYSDDQLPTSNRHLIGGGLLAAGLLGGGILGGIGGLLLGKAKVEHHQPPPPPPPPPTPPLTTTTQRTTTVAQLTATPTTPTMTLPFVKQKIVWLNGRKYIRVNGRLKPYHLFRSRLFSTWGPSCAQAARAPSHMPICQKYFGLKWRQLVLRWLLRKQNTERKELRRRELVTKKRISDRQIRKRRNELIAQKQRQQTYQNSPELVQYERGSDFVENNDEYDEYRVFSNELETETENDQELGIGLGGTRRDQTNGKVIGNVNPGGLIGIIGGRGIGVSGQRGRGVGIGIGRRRFTGQSSTFITGENGGRNFYPGTIRNNAWVTNRNLLPASRLLTSPTAGEEAIYQNNFYQEGNGEGQFLPNHEYETLVKQKLHEEPSEDPPEEVTQKDPNKVTQQVTKGVQVTVEERPSGGQDDEKKETRESENGNIQAERVTMQRIENIEKRMDRMLAQSKKED